MLILVYKGVLSLNVFELFASITLNSKGYKDALQQAQGETQQAGGQNIFKL